MKLAGFKIRCAVESDKFAAETYRFNFPDVPLYEGDIADFLMTEGEDHSSQYGLDNVDVVFGGPPCQGFSQIGTRNIHDKRNTLYEQFARVVFDLKPRVFLMENVPNLLLMRGGYYKDLILKRFADLGYSNTTYLVLNAAEYGVPQLRQRVVFVGIRDDHKLSGDLEAFCEEVLRKLRVKKPVPVHDAISDLPAEVVGSGEEAPYPSLDKPSQFQRTMRLDANTRIYSRARKLKRFDYAEELSLHNHHTKEMQEKRRHLISFLKPGQKADSLPKEIWAGKRPEKWRRLDPAKPSYTILAQMHRDMSEWVHPGLERWITVREAARLQSFHDGFIFKSSEWQQLKQIGNAVPPLLGRVAGKVAAAVLAELKPKRSKSSSARVRQSDLFNDSVAP